MSAKTKTRPTTETQQGRPHAATTGLAATKQTCGTGNRSAIHGASDLTFADSQEVASSRHETKENWPERSANAKTVSRRSGQVRAAWETRAPGNWGRDLNPRPHGFEPSEIPLLHPALKSLRPSFGSLRLWSAICIHANFKKLKSSNPAIRPALNISCEIDARITVPRQRASKRARRAPNTNGERR